MGKYIHDSICVCLTGFNRWKGDGIAQILVDTASFLKNIEKFDHLEFGIPSKEAISMSPSTWKLIEHSFLALLDAGINYRGQNVGSYMSGVAFDITSAADVVRVSFSNL